MVIRLILYIKNEMFLKINLGGTNLMKKQINRTLSILILLSAGLSGCMDEVENNDDNKLKIDFEKEAINFVENLSQYNYQITYEQFDDTMKSVLPVQDLQDAWEGLISTYGERLLAQIHPETGRIHPDFLQLRTATGRFACNKPNLQNIPRNSKEAPFRECFNPK